LKPSSATRGTDTPTLLIDKCPKAHGLWFDKGELQDIFERAQLDDDHKIKTLLAEMFGQSSRLDKTTDQQNKSAS